MSAAALSPPPPLPDDSLLIAEIIFQGMGFGSRRSRKKGAAGKGRGQERYYRFK